MGAKRPGCFLTVNPPLSSPARGERRAPQGVLRGILLAPGEGRRRERPGVEQVREDVDRIGDVDDAVSVRDGAVEALVRAVERSGADLSDQAQFRHTLGAIRLGTPYGPVRLDQRHQAVTTTTLARLVRAPSGRLVVEKLRPVTGIEHTFGGLLGPPSLPPSRTAPPCRRATPPSWAR